MSEQTITKILSTNDSGASGGHQAGILIPRKQRILSFFPSLDASRLNPRVLLRFKDSSGYFWEFAFIYYNNRFFGGTRNEYRLTRMTKYIREAGLVAGDEVLMHRNTNGQYSISYRRAIEPTASRDEAGRVVLTLGSGWRVVAI